MSSIQPLDHSKDVWSALPSGQHAGVSPVTGVSRFTADSTKLAEAPVSSPLPEDPESTAPADDLAAEVSAFMSDFMVRQINKAGSSKALSEMKKNLKEELSEEE